MFSWVAMLAAALNAPPTENTPMKTPSFIKHGTALAVAAGLAFCGLAHADTTTTTTREVTSDGTISSFEPQSFVIKSQTATDPLTYSSSTSTQYVDEAGNVVTRESIAPGAPVTVHYVREGDRMTADRVVVHKITTTTTEPGREPTHKEAKALRDAREHPEREARRAAEKGKPFPPEDPSIPKTTTTRIVTPPN